MIVLKFGGTSLANPEALRRVASIVAGATDQKPAVVVSALGKTTDRLVEVGQLSAAGDTAAASERIAELEKSHVATGTEVAPEAYQDELRQIVQSHLEELRVFSAAVAAAGVVSDELSDAILSIGERLSSHIAAMAFRSAGVKARRVDSREVIVTDSRHTKACPILDASNERLAARLDPLIDGGKVPVMGGFIASTEEGVTTTLGRGGSDCTASIVGAALSAEEVQIWTDVDGVMTADPSLVDEAYRIRRMSFAEAAELAYFGARVLHPSTMVPALENDIPIRVLNSRRPEIEGTLITHEPPKTASVAKSIAYKEGITVVDVRSSRMLMAHGFLARIFNVFEEHETAVDMVTTSEVSVSLTVDRTDQIDAIAEKLSEVAKVELRKNQAIVCVVGEGIRHAHGISAKIFSALEGVHITMISVGASRLNISFVVDERELADAVGRLHRMMFADIDRAVFA